MMQSYISKKFNICFAKFKNAGFLIACVFILTACSEKSLEAPEKPMLLSLMTHVVQGEQEEVEKMVLVAEDGEKIYQEIARYLRGSLSNMPTIKDIFVKSRKELGDGSLAIRIQIITEPETALSSMTVILQKNTDGTDRIVSVRIVPDKE